MTVTQKSILLEKFGSVARAFEVSSHIRRQMAEFSSSNRMDAIKRQLIRYMYKESINALNAAGFDPL